LAHAVLDRLPDGTSQTLITSTSSYHTAGLIPKQRSTFWSCLC